MPLPIVTLGRIPVLDTNYLLLSLVFSSIGLGYFIYGKKQKHKIIYYSGIGLMVFPYGVTNPAAMIALGLLLMALPKLLRHLDIGD